MSLKISTRLWAPTLLLLSVVVALTGLMAWRTRAQIELSNANLASQQAKLEDAQTWQGLSATNIARTVALVLSADAKVEQALKPMITATTAQISELQKRIEASVGTPEERDALGRVAAARKTYIAQRDEIRKQKDSGDAGGAAQALEEKLRPKFEAYMASQQAFVNLQHERSVALRDTMGAERMHTVWTVAAVMLSVAAAMVIVTSLLVRSITHAMSDLTVVARHVGEGHLESLIDTSRGDEVGDVLRSLSAMRDSLDHTVGQVREAAESIQVASSEVASGNADLSQRTEQTASNLQQTASSMEQLTSSVTQSADAAQQANQLAASASSVAQRGGAVVGQVVTTMDEINQSSRRIADIIGTIDGIAFQTNILALNAAVEAARAGEQGRGFAVVAGEVRSLAQRSAEAAREIKALIGTSVDKVEAGSRLVKDAGSTMDEIVSSVQRVSDIIGEISAAATEQRSGIAAVNGAVSQLDQMTQQNAALVEQSAAAADSLREQAMRLGAAVGTFHLKNEGTRRPAPSAARAPAIAEANTLSAAAPAPARAPKSPASVSRPSPAAATAALAPTPGPARTAPETLARSTIERAHDSARGTAPTSNDDWETF